MDNPLVTVTTRRGTIIHIQGIPFSLANDTLLETASPNLGLIDYRHNPGEPPEPLEKDQP